MSELEELKAKLDKAMEALELADGIMSFSRGDAYERECTEADYDKFNAIYDEFFPPPPPKEPEVLWKPKPKEPQIQCPHCKKKCGGKQGLKAHIEAKHLTNLTIAKIGDMTKGK